MNKIFLFFFTVLPFQSYACGENEYNACYQMCVIPRFFGGCAQEIKDCKCLPKMPPVRFPDINDGLKNISKESLKAISNISSALNKAGDDVRRNLEKSSKDMEAEIQRAGKDTEEAVSAIGHYVENTANDYGSSVSKLEARVREGKVIDALWHFGIEPLQDSEKNAGKAILDSSALRTIGQVAATAYGGPGGAAAYAAWLTYRETGDPSLAVRVGIISGATNWAMAEVGKIPTDSGYEIAKKAAVTGAIGGVAVAAAGGNEAAVKEAFLKAGAMVVVQDTFKSMTGHRLSGKASEGEPYCVSVDIANATLPASCAPPKDAYVRKPNGELDLDSNGVPKIDMSKVDPTRAAVGVKSADSNFGTERSSPMIAISKVPGMQGMAVFHDQWAMKWDMNAFNTPVSIIPAVVLTYWGLGAPYEEFLSNQGKNKKIHELNVISKSAGIENVSVPDSTIPLPDIMTTVKKNDVVQSYFCITKNNQQRLIAVEKPSEVKSFSCIVVYYKNKEIYPWRAYHEKNYCGSKAFYLAETLNKSGWNCMQSTMNRS